MPNYAHIIPNECNEMHGLSGANVPPDCDSSNAADLVRRGDAQIGKLVDKIIHSKVWTDRGNAAIVITFDESDGGRRTRGVPGLLRVRSNSAANFGGGHIPNSGHHQPRTATCRQLNPVQPLFPASHDGGGLRHQAVSGASRQHPAGCRDDDSAVRRKCKNRAIEVLGRLPARRFGAAPIRSCSRWGLPRRPCCQRPIMAVRKQSTS